jgi:peptide deformylase
MRSGAGSGGRAVYFRMPIRPIVRLGHPALRSPAGPLSPEDLGSPELQALIDDMVETMHEAHGVGLAAPQIGLGLQLFVYAVEAAPAAPPDEQDDEPADEPVPVLEIPLQVVVNPMLTPQAGVMVEDWEGCLSIPDLRGLVPRHQAVRLRGLDRHGQPIDRLVKGFEARIVQHEHDHLNGVVFLDRMHDFRSLAFYEEWEEYLAEGGDEQGQIATPADGVDPAAAAAAPASAASGSEAG